jgi:hypothetical protein
MAGSLLELLEIGGPEAVREQLAGLPPARCPRSRKPHRR